MPAFNAPQGYSPSRPPQIRDLEMGLNGEPNFLGIITSTGAAKDNSTTATPFLFSATQQQNGGVGNLSGTLAGRVLLFQPDAACYVMAATAVIGTTGVPTIATWSTIPPAANTVPGVLVQAQERIPFVMSSAKGWLQMIPVTGTVNLIVWELL